MNHTQDCGRHIEDLSDYLDTGASPDAEHIDHCPQCQARLAGLRSLNAAAMELLDDDVAVAAAEDSGWLDDLRETEGSVIAMVRAVGDSLGGVLIGRCRLEGDVSVPGAPVEVNINVSARYGYPLPSLAQELRDAVWAQLLLETELNVSAVNVAFTDMRPPLADGASGAGTSEGEEEGEQ